MADQLFIKSLISFSLRNIPRAITRINKGRRHALTDSVDIKADDLSRVEQRMRKEVLTGEIVIASDGRRLPIK